MHARNLKEKPALIAGFLCLSVREEKIHNKQSATLIESFKLKHDQK